MACEQCDLENEDQAQIAYYRWGSATIGIIACRKHGGEVIEALNFIQSPHGIIE